MLVVREGEAGAARCVTQPAHAWISGQLARAWGNDAFGAVAPREPACLAAEQHDVGWTAWERAPQRDPATGHPFHFTDLPVAAHVEVLLAGPGLLATQSAYAALVTSLHATALYERRDLARQAPEDAQRIRTFLAEHASIQERLAARLGIDREDARRNQRLLWAWDGLSLALLLDWLPFTARDVPAAGGSEAVDVVVSWERAGTVAVVDPWPFRAADRLTVRTEARRLEAPAPDEDAMRAALAAAPVEPVAFELVPAA